MTIGDGIFYSTILLVLAGSIYVISIKAKWKAVVKVFGVLVVAVIVTGGAFIGYEQYQNQPQPTPEPEELVAVTEYMGIKIDDAPVDVTLAKGKPDSEGVISQADSGRFTQANTYADFSIAYRGDEAPNTIWYVCTYTYETNRTTLLGVDHYASESSLLERLGTPSYESINKAATIKLMSYLDLNVAYQVEKGRVSAVCMVDGELHFTEEYGATEEDASQ